MILLIAVGWLCLIAGFVLAKLFQPHCPDCERYETVIDGLLDQIDIYSAKLKGKR